MQEESDEEDEQLSEPISQSDSKHQQLPPKQSKKHCAKHNEDVEQGGKKSVVWDGWSSSSDDATQLDFTESR